VPDQVFAPQLVAVAVEQRVVQIEQRQSHRVRAGADATPSAA
jgi:hypothetical protein